MSTNNLQFSPIRWPKPSKRLNCSLQIFNVCNWLVFTHQKVTRSTHFQDIYQNTSAWTRLASCVEGSECWRLTNGLVVASNISLNKGLRWNRHRVHLARDQTLKQAHLFGICMPHTPLHLLLLLLFSRPPVPFVYSPIVVVELKCTVGSF